MSLMNNLQVLQNKARKIIPHRPFYLSATDAIVTLKWLNLEQRAFKIITQERDMLRVPFATKNWGKKKMCYHSLKDWNNLD
ncbi:hypothetical protein pdam_00020711 [Pocillopora damicornis]|uniref:Uncharacterized protein n=1 Tax=Pocillopora damicornis TaxID=46731 RepID=A0A3M6TH36_POCDA|nr:hypothetical protein pdam_00020711 [Pocillopora damicornis]